MHGTFPYIEGKAVLNVKNQKKIGMVGDDVG